MNNKGVPSFRIYYLHTVSILARIISAVAIGVLLLFVVPLVVPYVDNANSFQYVRSTLTAEQTINTIVKQNIPTKIAGKDMTRWIVIVGMFFLSSSLIGWAERMKEKAQYLKFKF
ncbi:MAG TPA: hypothetical protein VKI62_02235, partial [Bacteroidota bacterium]|nr:hypothetical protein [Bacteroidota bacterium]